jgi:hypothetical protein
MFLTASLDHFIQKNITFMNLLSIKLSRLVGTIRKPDKFVWFSNAIRLSDHSTTGRKSTIPIPDWSGFSDVDCTLKLEKWILSLEDYVKRLNINIVDISILHGLQQQLLKQVLVETKHCFYLQLSITNHNLVEYLRHLSSF